MLKSTQINLVEVSDSDWDALVTSVYGKPYSLQQQNGCMDRRLIELVVPGDTKDFTNVTIPEEINGDEMGVSLAAWKSRDPKSSIGECSEQWEIDLFWQRNFYPELGTLANDLHSTGHLPAGTYHINIDW